MEEGCEKCARDGHLSSDSLVSEGAGVTPPHVVSACAKCGWKKMERERKERESEAMAAVAIERRAGQKRKAACNNKASKGVTSNSGGSNR